MLSFSFCVLIVKVAATCVPVPEWSQSPVYGFQTFRFEYRVGPREMPAPEEGTARQRGRVRSLEHVVAAAVYEFLLAPGITAPEQEDHTLAALRYAAYDRIGELLPADAVV